MTRRRETAAIATWVLLTVLAPGLPSAAQIYKWVDASGTVHFSHDPPAPAAHGPAVEVLPDVERRPTVRKDPEPSSAESARPPGREGGSPGAEARDDSPHGSAPADDEPGAIFVEESDTVIVEEGWRDPATRYRATSPRNRPGQPIRQPVRQPVRQPRRGR